MTANLKVVTLHESNYREAPATLRLIAEEIERGDFGEVGCCAIALLADRLHVFGCGPDSGATAIGMVLHAGFNQLSRDIEEHGK